MFHVKLVTRPNTYNEGMKVVDNMESIMESIPFIDPPDTFPVFVDYPFEPTHTDEEGNSIFELFMNDKDIKPFVEMSKNEYLKNIAIHLFIFDEKDRDEYNFDDFYILENGKVEHCYLKGTSMVKKRLRYKGEYIEYIE